jgi:dipeptidyl aminopeptidase/acylaminoacyl peptidase
VGRAPRIRPDYAGVTIPPNIAPLNFLIKEPGTRYYVTIRSPQGDRIAVSSRSSKIMIPESSWHALLGTNAGKTIHIDVYVKTQDTQWQQFDSLAVHVAAEKIDPYLFYRRIRPIHNRWSDMSIRQRHLRSFEDRMIVDYRSFPSGCVHCHTLLGNDPANMLMHSRTSGGPAMVLIQNGQATSIDSRTPFGSAPMGHSAWHPSGELIAFTVYKVRQFFHSAQMEVREAMDLEAAVGYYVVDSAEIKTAPALSQKNRLETFPTWSPDGRWLYFCSAPVWWTEHNEPPERYDEIRYDLMRVSFDPKTDTWGQAETVLSADQTGLSITQPRFSPDGRFLLFCMCHHGCFPTFQESSDLYLMDIQTGQYRRLACNSDQAESWHCWSSNGRWIAFSSKRRARLFNRVYFSYVDRDGRTSKPFVLPQKDPTFDDSHMRLYQLPELAKGPMPIRGEKLARLIRLPQLRAGSVPMTSATPKAGAASGYAAPPNRQVQH